MVNKAFFNTIKISSASLISILMAKIMGLDFYVSAGIVTILTIQSTKIETINTAFERFYAFISALIISTICFIIFGFNLLGFGAYLIIYIFICQYFKWISSMAMNSVLISHFLTFNSMNSLSLYNEIALFVIGVSIGIIANLHLRKDIDAINALKKQADEQIKHILSRMSIRIIQNIDDYDGNCFEKLNELIVAAKAVSIENDKNVLIQKQSYDHEYIKMREHQTQVLYEMYKTIRKLHTTPFTAHIISDFLQRIANEYHADNDCEQLLNEFRRIDLQMQSVQLPTERKEFEDRARLFSLLRLIEEFLEIKKSFAKNIV